MLRSLAWISVVPLLGSFGCDISATTFSGTSIIMTMQDVSESLPGQHLELWARTRFDDIVRIDGINDIEVPDTANPGKTKTLHSFPGFALRKAVSMGDPCLIDDKGNLLTSASAYPTAVVING